MTRKKQGLRSYHHKTRNGCMQCKRRRVKCNMQIPACGNCVRRSEICEYPSFSESNSPPQLQGPQPPWANEPLPGSSHQSPWTNELPQTSMALVQSLGNLNLPTSIDPTALAVWPLSSASPYSGTIETNVSYNHSMELASNLFHHSWFTPEESAIWVPALARLTDRFPYLQHGMLAIVYLRQHAEQNRQARLHGDPLTAYQHQLTASSLFRQAPPTINEDNWMAVLIFGTFMLIFQFYTQFACDDEHFDIIETLRVVRGTMAIENAARPFLRRTRQWALILARTAIHNPQPDARLRRALQSLAAVVSSSIDNASNDDEEETAEINRQAFFELREWTLFCDSQPRRWEHYCYWPHRVRPEFLELLADGDDIALITFIHWCAIMFRSQKPFVKYWARRAASHAASNLDGEWGELLRWSVEEFGSAPLRPSEDCRVPVLLQPPGHTGDMEVDPVPVSASGTGEYTHVLSGDLHAGSTSRD